MRRKPPIPQDDQPAPVEPQSRLPTEPWMKYTGVSGLAALIVWFRTPKRIRGETLRGAWMAMLLFGTLVAALFAIAGLIMLVDWALHGS
jgi:hypothetical protein